MNKFDKMKVLIFKRANVFAVQHSSYCFYPIINLANASKSKKLIDLSIFPCENENKSLYYSSIHKISQCDHRYTAFDLY